MDWGLHSHIKDKLKFRGKWFFFRVEFFWKAEGATLGRRANPPNEVSLRDHSPDSFSTSDYCKCISVWIFLRCCFSEQDRKGREVFRQTLNPVMADTHGGQLGAAGVKRRAVQTLEEPCDLQSTKNIFTWANLISSYRRREVMCWFLWDNPNDGLVTGVSNNRISADAACLLTSRYPLK